MVEGFLQWTVGSATSYLWTPVFIQFLHHHLTYVRTYGGCRQLLNQTKQWTNMLSVKYSQCFLINNSMCLLNSWLQLPSMSELKWFTSARKVFLTLRVLWCFPILFGWLLRVYPYTQLLSLSLVEALTGTHVQSYTGIKSPSLILSVEYVFACIAITHLLAIKWVEQSSWVRA